MQSGMIFDIRRYSINDGPGIRVTVFFKGCPLNCAWCHNPESISNRAQKMYSKGKCIGCSSCIESCPDRACTLTPGGIINDRDLCTGCGECAEVCPTKATEMSGRIMTVEEIVEIVEKERIFFDQSGGGVTFSGGEPLLQPAFLLALLEELGAKAIHRTLDTTGFTKAQTLLEVEKYTDHFLYDLKLMDSELHRKWTGVSNERILENLTLLAETGASINIRIPLVAGVNDSLENIVQTASYIAHLPGEKKVSILPYHNIMAGKWEKLGEEVSLESMGEPTEQELKNIIDTFNEYGVDATVGG